MLRSLSAVVAYLYPLVVIATVASVGYFFAQSIMSLGSPSPLPSIDPESARMLKNLPPLPAPKEPQ